MIEILTVQPQFDERGLIPVVVQDASSGDVLMLAYMNQEALDCTLSTGKVHFWSRSRDELWRKGATSGNEFTLLDLRLDCDGDSVLVRVLAAGPACHTGLTSCFHNSLQERP
jgi:phosphoribosyl-AMP cyclohydrolase